MHAPSANTIEITAIYLAEKSGTRRDRWAVHRIAVVSAPSADGLREGEEIEASGESEPYDFGAPLNVQPDFRVGCEYRFYGVLGTNKFREKTTTVFKFKTFVRCTPHSKQAVLRYLQEAPHVGPKVATALLSAFGTDAVKILREFPDVAAAISIGRNRSALTLPQAEAASAHLKKMAALEHSTMEMMELLDGYGLPKATAKKAIAKWGNRAAETIRRNPLGTLMGFRGCGFLKADKVYQSLALPNDAQKRIALCAWHTLSSDANGNTWLARSKVLADIRLKVGGNLSSFPPAKAERYRDKTEAPVDRALRLGIRSGLLAEYVDDAGTRWLAEGEKAREEAKLASIILAAMDEPNPWEAVLASPELESALTPLEPYQRNALLRVLHGGAIGILGGGPGSGKTFTAAALMKLLVATFGAGQIAATAFTGKAARRFTEGMAAYQIPVAAVTTHSLLKVKNFSGDAADNDGDEQSEFTFNAENPLPHRLIVVDEVSMDDVPLLLAILEARSRGCGVLLVGDVNQLPPIGHGAPLRDLIAAGLPYGELTEIRRNAGQVVKVCKKLRDNQRLAISDFVNDIAKVDIEAADPRNCVLVAANSPAEQIAKLIAVLKFVRDRYGFDPIWDCQVIVARNSAGDVSKRALNVILQREFNPTAEVVPNCMFRVGDKAMQTKNQSYPMVSVDTWEPLEEKTNVANGEFCKVIAIQEKRIIARFSTPDRLVAVPRVKEFAAKAETLAGEGESSAAPTKEETREPDFTLGMAATCHKMQGSQAKCIVVILDEGAKMMNTCEWFLTADSRMESLCVNIGKFNTIQYMQGNPSLDKRKTFLRERIEGGRLWGERVWWVSNNNTEVNGHAICKAVDLVSR